MKTSTCFTCLIFGRTQPSPESIRGEFRVFFTKCQTSTVSSVFRSVYSEVSIATCFTLFPGLMLN